MPIEIPYASRNLRGCPFEIPKPTTRKKTTAEWLRPRIFDSKDFGGIGDGVADDTGALQSAIYAACVSQTAQATARDYPATTKDMAEICKEHVNRSDLWTIQSNAQIIGPSGPTPITRKAATWS